MAHEELPVLGVWNDFNWVSNWMNDWGVNSHDGLPESVFSNIYLILKIF